MDAPHADGRFCPDKPVTMTTVHRVLVLALGMQGTARTAERAAHPRRRRRSTRPATSARLMLGMRLGLRYNSADRGAGRRPPKPPMPRSQVAYSLVQGQDARLLGRPVDRATSTTASCCRRWGRRARRSCSGACSYVGLPVRLGRRMGLRLAGAVRARRAADRRVRLLGLLVVDHARERRGVWTGRRRPVRTRGGHCPSAPPPTWRGSATSSTTTCCPAI